MKRHGRLFEQIVDPANIRDAWLRRLRGKRRKAEVIRFSRSLNERLGEVHRRLIGLEPQWGTCESFVVREPKTRIISAVPLDQRIMHHAIMNVLEPIFDRHLVDYSYACRRGRGTHAAVRYAFSCTRRHPWFLELGVRKHFDSIDHLVLKSQLRRLIKDERALYLLDGIMDSYETVPGKGLPIGNLTSRFFANHYLYTDGRGSRHQRSQTRLGQTTREAISQTQGFVRGTKLGARLLSKVYEAHA